MKIHQILTSTELPYEFYLSIVSALKVHKPEEYNLWVLETPTGLYFEHIKNRITIRQITFDFVNCSSFEEWGALSAFEGRDDHFVRVHLKDVLSYKVLYEEGGMFMDLDTLSIYDCTSFFDTCRNVLFFKHGLPYPDSFNVAVMMSQMQAPLMWELFEEAKKVLSGEPMKWGDTGPQLVNRVAGKYLPDEEATMLSYIKEYCVVDGHGFSRIIDILSDSGYIWDQCKVLHIYRSSEYYKQTMVGKELNEDFIYRSKSPYATLVKRLLSVDEWNPCNVRQPHKTVRAIKTFHIPGIAHVPTRKSESSCAFTQKTVKLATMLKSLGHRVIFYGLEGSEVDCDEFVQVASTWALEQTYGKQTDKNQFYAMTHGPVHDMFYANAIREINIRKSPNDFLLCPFGMGHKPIADGVNLPLTVESGIGYMNTFAKFRVWESSAWMHYVYGKTGQDDGPNYDCIIPNYFDLEQFEFSDTKQCYLLYLGRIIGRKGIEIALQLAGRMEIPLKVAGKQCGENINLDRPFVEYVGCAGVEERKQLLRDAKALLVPTIYIGPFEGVHVEAGLSGTPVITSDWGVFPETVIEGVTGFRCRTFEQYYEAVEKLPQIQPIDCYNNAVAKYDMHKVKWQYEQYCDRLLDLRGKDGWYTLHPDRGGFDAWASPLSN